MNTTHLYYLGAPEGYTAVMKTTHLYDLGVQDEYNPSVLPGSTGRIHCCDEDNPPV